MRGSVRGVPGDWHSYRVGVKGIVVYLNKSTLLLDMNSTFMFGEDNFGVSDNFSNYYHRIGGTLSEKEVNKIIRSVYAYLDKRYPDERYRNNFPSLEEAIHIAINHNLSDEEMSKIVDTFSHHEIGSVPIEYVEVLHKLSKKYQLAVVIDIWSPKTMWLKLFEKIGIKELFSASSFSSDHGMVKPSPKPFEFVINQLGVNKDKCLIIGDSVRRDLGGALAVGVDCVLVGGARHENALGCYENLLELSYEL